MGLTDNPLNYLLPLTEYMIVLIFTRGKDVSKAGMLFAEAICKGHTTEELQLQLDERELPQDRFVQIRWKHGERQAWRYSTNYQDWINLSNSASRIDVEGTRSNTESRWPASDDRHR